MPIIRGSDAEYEVGKLIATDSAFRLYLCKRRDPERLCLMQIAIDASGNGALDRAAYILGRLEGRAAELEAEYAKVKTDQKDRLNYQLHFPELIESFSCEEQEGRQVNVLAFRNVDDPRKMSPIARIVGKDQLRADLRTSAWIMGKALKFLGFAHDFNLRSRRTDASNWLLEVDQHYIVLFDFSGAALSFQSLDREVRSEEIAQAAQAIIELVGGDREAGNFPDDEEGRLKPYTDILMSLGNGEYADAQAAHDIFYSVVHDLWPRGFYPAAFRKR